MELDRSIREEIEKTLQSIDGISRADTPLFFYTRLQAKLEKRSAMHTPFWMVVTKPTVSLVTLSLLVILNIAALRYHLHSSKQMVTQQSPTGIQKFVQEYDLDGNSVYNDKTTK
ncbi:MAG: hypothetical protein ABIS69_03770 [Sediminibacterium sp.]